MADFPSMVCLLVAAALVVRALDRDAATSGCSRGCPPESQSASSPRTRSLCGSSACGPRGAPHNCGVAVPGGPRTRAVDACPLEAARPGLGSPVRLRGSAPRGRNDARYRSTYRYIGSTGTTSTGTWTVCVSGSGARACSSGCPSPDCSPSHGAPCRWPVARRLVRRPPARERINASRHRGERQLLPLHAARVSGVLPARRVDPVSDPHAAALASIDQAAEHERTAWPLAQSS